MEINWKRTGLKEYPEDGQNCLIYFDPTGYCISKFSWEKYEDDAGKTVPGFEKVAVFSDRGGWLGDEDVLWILLKELKIPEEYKKTRKE